MACFIMNMYSMCWFCNNFSPGNGLFTSTFWDACSFGSSLSGFSAQLHK